MILVCMYTYTLWWVPLIITLRKSNNCTCNLMLLIMIYIPKLFSSKSKQILQCQTLEFLVINNLSFWVFFHKITPFVPVMCEPYIVVIITSIVGFSGFALHECILWFMPHKTHIVRWKRYNCFQSFNFYECHLGYLFTLHCPCILSMSRSDYWLIS